MGIYIGVPVLSGVLFLLYREFIKEGGIPAAKCQLGFHQFDSWRYVHDHSCEQRRACTLCGKVATGGETKLEHLWMLDYLREDSCEQQDICVRCKETRGAITVEHAWKQVFLGENSNQRQKICKRCSIQTDIEVAETEWPWLFRAGARRSRFLALHHALQELAQSKDMCAVVDEARGKQVKIVKTHLPNTNVVLRGFNIDNMDLVIYPDGLHIVQNPGKTLTSIEPYTSLSFQISRIQVEESRTLDDAEVIKQTWEHTTYDGKPDPRYPDNPSVVVLSYVLLTFVTQGSAKFKVAISNNKGAQGFYDALADYVRSHGAEPQESEPQAQHAGSSSAYDREYESGDSRKADDSKNSSRSGKTGPFTYDAACKTLGIQSGATAEEIRRAYLAMVQKYHPDKVFNLADEYKVIAEAKMKELNAAYDLLKETAR